MATALARRRSSFERLRALTEPQASPPRKPRPTRDPSLQRRATPCMCLPVSRTAMPGPFLCSSIAAGLRWRGGDFLALNQSRSRWLFVCGAFLKTTHFISAVVAQAIIAGVMGAKRTADLMPFCHPLPLHNCEILVDVRAVHEAALETVRACTPFPAERGSQNKTRRLPPTCHGPKIPQSRP